MADGLGGLRPAAPNIKIQNSGTIVGVGIEQLTPEFLNFVAGTNVTLTLSEDLTNFNNRRYNVIIASTGGGGSGGGITRVISSITDDTTAGADASTDYYYLAAGSLTLTLPNGVDNTNLYNIKSLVSTGSLVIAASGTQTIDGDNPITVFQTNTSLTFVASGGNWNII